MKITNIRYEDLVEIIIHSVLTEDDKNVLIEKFNPRNINITHRLKQ